MHLIYEELLIESVISWAYIIGLYRFSIFKASDELLLSSRSTIWHGIMNNFIAKEKWN